MATYEEALQRIWNDAGFKQKLFDNPKPVLSELGLDFPANVEVRLFENTPTEMHFVLPNKAEIAESIDLEKTNPGLGKVIKKAWANASFKADLFRDPRTAVADEAGITIPSDLKVILHEDTPNLKNLVLPVNPQIEELSDADLAAVAGGASKGPQTPSFGCMQNSAPIIDLQTFRPVGAIASFPGGAITSGQNKC